MSKETVYLIWDDENLTIVPSIKQMERDVLTLDVKSLVSNEEQPWKREVRKHKEKVFEVVNEKPFRTIRTLQGFLDDVIMWLVASSVKFEVKDMRESFPSPRLDLMKGFRFSQKEATETALNKNRSGLVELPTRYGKAYVLLNMIRAYPSVRTVLVIPGSDLLTQTYEFMRDSLPCRDVRAIGGKFRNKEQSPELTVCSADSLHYCDTDTTRLLLADETHALVTDGRLPLITSFKRARKLGAGATPKGRFDGRDRLMTGAIGPILYRKTFKEAVEEGAICPIVCLLYVMPEPTQFYGTRDHAYRGLLYQNPKVAAIVDELSNRIIPSEWQTLMFIKNEKQADYMLHFTGDSGVVAMAKKMTDKQRDKMFARMASGDIKRCLASDIYAQGVTFSDLRVVANLAGGGPYTQSIQKPGRLAETIPGKRYGILVDFIFPFPANNRNSASALAYDSRNRYQLYKDRGYEIVFVKDLRQLDQEFKKYM